MEALTHRLMELLAHVLRAENRHWCGAAWCFVCGNWKPNVFVCKLCGSKVSEALFPDLMAELFISSQPETVLFEEEPLKLTIFQGWR